MLDIDFIKSLKYSSHELGNALGTLSQCSMKVIPLKIKTQAQGIRFVCKHIYSSTLSYLNSIEHREKHITTHYTESDLISDLLIGAFLFIRICGTSYHYYEDVLDACDEYCRDYKAWEDFHKLKAGLEQLYTLNFL